MLGGLIVNDHHRHLIPHVCIGCEQLPVNHHFWSEILGSGHMMWLFRARIAAQRLHQFRKTACIILFFFRWFRFQWSGLRSDFNLTFGHSCRADDEFAAAAGGPSPPSFPARSAVSGPLVPATGVLIVASRRSGMIMHLFQRASRKIQPESAMFVRLGRCLRL